MLDLAHLHPMILHFPLALLPLAVLLEAWVLFSGENPLGRSCSAHASLGLLVVAALTALIAAGLGDMALDIAIDKGFPDEAMEDHEDLGFASAWLMLGLAVVQGWLFWKKPVSRTPAVILLVLGLVVMAVLLTTAWYGGNLVYGLGINVVR
jgi:uncharacterized membrane protein